MENAYVINLKSSTDRWDQIQKAFEGSNIRLHRVEPVKLVRSKHKTLRRREFGAKSLTMTVLKLVKMAKRRGLPEILILEDDCSPVKGFENIWAKVKSWLRSHKDKWDIYSGGSSSIKYPFPVGNTKDIKFFIPKSAHSSHWIWIHSMAYDTVINEYKATLLNCNGNYHGATDDINNKLNRILSLPFVAYQQDNYSILSGTFRPLIKKFINSEKKLRRQTRKIRLIKG